MLIGVLYFAFAGGGAAQTNALAAVGFSVAWLVKCAYCQSKPFQIMSHVIPLPHGGTTAENCVPACYGCSSKCKTSARERLQAYLAEAKHRYEKGEAFPPFYHPSS